MSAGKDHLIATGIIYTASTGRLPAWVRTPAQALVMCRGCTLAEAEEMVRDDAEPAKTLREIMVLRGRTPDGFAYNWRRLIAVITGWDEARIAAALNAAEAAGLLVRPS